MSEDMIDLTAGEMRLRRRLEAYAEHRLSPDLTTTSRMRARILAHAHRQAGLARAAAALVVVRPGAALDGRDAHRRRRARRSALPIAAAVALLAAVVGGAAAASAPGGPLYDARLRVEEVTLPIAPSERAVAELDRLARRLAEADAAARAGDPAAVSAALAAYERIMAGASADVLAANDPVAAAAFETGLGRNVVVLQALTARVPAQAAKAIDRAVERAIERSANAIDRVDEVKKPKPTVSGSGGATGGNDGAGGAAGNGGSGGGAPSTPKPTKTPAAKPTATPRPTREPNDGPDPTPKPAKTGKPGSGQGQGEQPGSAPD